MTKTGCPSKAPNCAKGNLTCTAVGGVKKRCSTRDEAPKAKTAYLKTSRPVLVLYFPTTGKHLLYWKELQFSPTGKGQRRTYRVVHLPGPLESLISFDFVVNISCY